MGASLILCSHAIPAAAIDPEATDLTAAIDAYAAVIDAASDDTILDLLADDVSFDVDDAYAAAADVPVEERATIPGLAEAARAHLKQAVIDHVVHPHHRYRTELKIGDRWYAFYGGTSWGDEPFDGFTTVCAIASLPGLSLTDE